MGDIAEKGIAFQVTPEFLMQSAQSMQLAEDKARKELESFQTLVEKTGGCFRGKVQEAFAKEASVLILEWKEMLCCLQNNISQLQEIAQTYKQAEGENADVSMGISDSF